MSELPSPSAKPALAGLAEAAAALAAAAAAPGEYLKQEMEDQHTDDLSRQTVRLAVD